MRSALFALALSFLAFGGCILDPRDPRTYNHDNSGTQLCEGPLFTAASMGVAFCTTPPQRCIAARGDASNNIVCDCVTNDGGLPQADAGMGNNIWICHEQR